jgi:hypothetical protein
VGGWDTTSWISRAKLPPPGVHCGLCGRGQLTLAGNGSGCAGPAAAEPYDQPADHGEDHDLDEQQARPDWATMIAL